MIQTNFLEKKNRFFFRRGNYMMTKGISPYTPRDFMLQALELMLQACVQLFQALQQLPTVPWTQKT